MKTLKPITEISTEELLESLKDNPGAISSYEHSNDVLDFISTYGIQNGDYPILLPLIYGLYSKWSSKPLHRSPFGKELTKLFVSVRYGLGTTYRLNKPKTFFLEQLNNKKQNKTKRKPWLKHFQKFIANYNLKPGRFFVKDIVLYNLYDKWTYKNNSKNPLSLLQFLKFCRLFFKKPMHKRIKHHEWFAVDSSIKEYLTPDLINLMKQK